VANQRIKIKQITSGDSPYGHILMSDGSGNTNFVDYSLQNIGTSFPPSPTGGTLFYRSDVDILFYYDNSISQWLSVESQLFTSGRANIQKNISGYMYVGTAVQSSTEGFYMKRNGTILSASVDNSTIMGSNRDIEIRVNNSTTNRVLLTMTTGNKSVSTISANQDFNGGDLIQTIGIANGGTDFNNISVIFEISWRI